MSYITSAQNTLIKHALKLQKEPSYRQEQETLFLEGKKLVLEALDKGTVLQLFIKEGADIQCSCQVNLLKEHLVDKLSTLRSPEGYFAEVKRPKNASLGQEKRLLVLDGIQDPGNMGTLIRTALAFGFEGIFIREGSVDPYSPKVLRASMGASLYIPIQIGTEEEFIEIAEKNSLKIYIADAQGSSIEKTLIQTPFMLVLGNESNGSLLKNNAQYTQISLPISQIDSLNVAVAGSLLMYLLRGVNEN